MTINSKNASRKSSKNWLHKFPQYKRYKIFRYLFNYTVFREAFNFVMQYKDDDQLQETLRGKDVKDGWPKRPYQQENGTKIFFKRYLFYFPRSGQFTIKNKAESTNTVIFSFQEGELVFFCTPVFLAALLSTINSTQQSGFPLPPAPFNLADTTENMAYLRF